MFVLETDRLRLREMTMNDADHVMEILGDPIAMRYYPSTFPREVALQWITMNREYYVNHGAGMWACELKEDGVFAGLCGIIPQTVDGVEEKEIGYLFVRKYWGRGLATEAARAVMDYGFLTLGLNRLIATIYHQNAPSVKVAERLGMTFEKRTFVGEGRSDDLIYSIDGATKA